MNKKKLNQEIEHFNNYAKSINLGQLEVDNIFKPSVREGQFILKYLPENLKGKYVLDIGCGIGITSVFFAKRGAKVTGIDISPNMVKVAQNVAKRHGVSKLAQFKVGDVENLKYKPGMFDIVIGKSVLHHVDFTKAIEEIFQVLKPGGLAIFSDPLDYNPLSKIYDKFASKGLRSESERRLSLKDIEIMKGKFKKIEWIGINITTFILFAIDFLYLKFIKLKVPVNWFERIEYGNSFARGYKVCDTLDRFMPKHMQLLGWKIVIICKK